MARNSGRVDRNTLPGKPQKQPGSGTREQSKLESNKPPRAKVLVLLSVVTFRNYSHELSLVLLPCSPGPRMLERAQTTLQSSTWQLGLRTQHLGLRGALQLPESKEESSNCYNPERSPPESPGSREEPPNHWDTEEIHTFSPVCICAKGSCSGSRPSVAGGRGGEERGRLEPSGSLPSRSWSVSLWKEGTMG